MAGFKARSPARADAPAAVAGRPVPPDAVKVPTVARPCDRRGFTYTAAPGGVQDGVPQVWCRAVTAGGARQPETSVWRGGYNFNGWHKVHAEPAAPP